MLLIDESKKITSKKSDLKFFRTITREVISCALKNKISVYQPFDKKSILIFKKGAKLVWMYNMLTSKTNPIGEIVAKNKNLTKKLLEKMGYPVAPSETVSELSELDAVADKIGFPLVVKPVGSELGKGITININNPDILRESFLIARKIDRNVIIEKHIAGDYYRITYIADGSFATTKNLPATITGDGNHTAEELIKKENKYNEERYAIGRLTKIKISEKTKRFLASYGYALQSIVPKGKIIPLCFSGFDGGEYIDATEKTHPYYIKIGEKITKELCIPMVGIDILAKDISLPLNEQGGVIIEINGTSPDIQFHKKPTVGKPRDLIPNLLEYLFK